MSGILMSFFNAAASVAATTWNPLDKHANITLSGGDLTANGVGAVQLVRATRSMPLTNKCYWECELQGDGTTNLLRASGIVSGAVGTNVQIGGPGANLGLYIHGQVLYYNNSVLFDFTNNTGTQRTQWAYDPATRRVWVGLVGVGWFNSGDPAAGTNYVQTLPAGTFYPACTPSGGFITANFGASGFAGSIPSGFVSFNSAS